MEDIVTRRLFSLMPHVSIRMRYILCKERLVVLQHVLRDVFRSFTRKDDEDAKKIVCRMSLKDPKKGVGRACIFDLWTLRFHLGRKSQ